MNEPTWHQLYTQAVAVCDDRVISPTMEAGSVAAALSTSTVHVYTGISIDTACSMGYCAERNALGSMLTAGETEVKRLVAVKGTEVVLPCGVCREFLMQLGPASAATTILVSLDPLKTLTLGELLPHYWQTPVEKP